MKVRLSQKEKAFCACFIQNGNAYIAAKEAGYGDQAKEEGKRLLCRQEVQNEIIKLSKTAQPFVSALAKIGYQRLAFGDVADAVYLLYAEHPKKEDIEQLDLFSVSEIRKPKDGAMEIKFADRLKALEKLETLEEETSVSAASFYEALNLGAKAIADKENEH